MFGFGIISRFKDENGSCKILKPVWDVITDYLVIFLVTLSIVFAGMEASSGSFECLPAVDCPSISRPNTNSSMLLHINRNACEAFYNSQNGNIIKRTVVVTDIQSSLHYVKFVNSECSKRAIPNFLAYFPFWLFTQAFFLIIIDNLWLKLPTTASVIEHFVALVMECYASPCPNLALAQALSNVHATRGQGTTLQDVGNTEIANPHEQAHEDIEMMNTISDSCQSSEFHILDDPTTINAIKTLYEKVKTLKENVESSHKFVKIWQLYLLQSLCQAISALTFFVIDIYYIRDLPETMVCTITQHIPVPHDYFICSHGLAPAFTLGLKSLYLPILAISIVTFIFIITWTVVKIVKNKCEYHFENERLPKLEGTILSDIHPVNDDLGFLLHLLHSYDKSLVVRLAHFLSKSNKKKIQAFLLNKEYPVPKLKRCLRENENKLTLKNLSGIPQTIFELATEIVTLEFIQCGPLESETFFYFPMLTGVRRLAIIKCGLKSIPRGVLMMEQLEELNLKGNSIELVDWNISLLWDLESLDLSDNNIKTISFKLSELHKLFAVYLSGNSELEMQSLKIALACERLFHLDPPQHLSDRKHELNQLEENKFDKAVKFASRRNFVIPYTPEKAPHIDQTDDERIYKMNSCPKGIAVVLNNYSYSRCATHYYQDRLGSDIDVSMLMSLFEDIGFVALKRLDCMAGEAKKFLEECAGNTDYKECDCIAVAVMSHGTEEGLVFPDGKVLSVEELIDCVEKSPLYQGKPKLFFIQACRGSRRAGNAAEDDRRECEPVRDDDNLSLYQDQHAMLSVFPESDGLFSSDENTETDAVSSGHVMVEPPAPKGADVLLSYSTLPGYISSRSIKNGTSYINALVETFVKHAWEEDILSLLTLVNYKVVRGCTAAGWRQVPAPQSTLQKKLYLFPGYPRQPKQIKPSINT